MVKKLNFILFLFVGLTVMAQIPKDEVLLDSSVFPKENVKLVVNSNVLLAGELLQYKGFILNASKKKSALSKILYVSLRNANDSVVFNHKLKVENATVNGDFFVPSNLKTGIYKLIGYTNFSKNNINDAFTQVNIFIINTFVKSEVAPAAKETVEIAASPEKVGDVLTNKANTKSLKIKLNKQSFGLREKVTLNIENTDNNDNGSYVLSVRKVNPVEIIGEIAKASKSKSSAMFYVPELRGELISGLVVSKQDNIPAANKEVALTIPGEDYIFKIAKTNAQGRFFFSVDETYNAEESILQLYGNEAYRSAYNLVLDSKDFKLNEEEYNLKLDKQLKDWLLERSVQLQVENAYYDTKRDSILTKKTNTAFYDNLGTVFLLDDYTRFPTVRETFIEVVTLAAVRGTGSDTRFLVYNAYDPNRIAKFNSIDPLVLMDGMLVQDYSELLNYNARNIESVRVVTEPYRYGPKIYSGIIAVETKEKDFVPRHTNDYVAEINLPPAVKNKKYYRPDYSDKVQLSRIPDYRVQLLWQPEINLSKEGFTTSFYTSDVSGVYEILITGFSKNGLHILNKYYFKVSKN
ncbi:hypothetical protein K8089_07950 [Aequorivita sp. F47161]|uniref:MG2 domain-containing protein n=1 Tax=Aequorivita vitellina TaxID=2874475 RepID=A0A9X1U2V5_9FLAO|nr:hypothetical protein [Aequorivita vitellina]MCG2418953.1 hypothetical protein [Aequorivita vitellina]